MLAAPSLPGEASAAPSSPPSSSDGAPSPWPDGQKAAHEDTQVSLQLWDRVNGTDVGICTPQFCQPHHSPLIPWYRVSLTLTTQFHTHTHTHTSPQRPFQYQALFVQNYLLLHVWNLIILYPLCLQISTNVHNSLLLHVQNLITVPSLPSDFNWNPVHFISIFVVETILMITPELVFVNIYRDFISPHCPCWTAFASICVAFVLIWSLCICSNTFFFFLSSK